MNPRVRVKEEMVEEEGEEDKRSIDKIDPFGDNPGWDPSWVKAFKINYLGKVGIVPI